MKLRKATCFTVLLWLISTIGICQKNAALAIETQGVEITHFSFYSDSTGITSPSALNLNLFRNDTQNIASIIAHPPFNLWLMLDVTFTSTDTSYKLLSNALEKSTLFTQNELGIWQSEAGGFYNRLNDRAFVFKVKGRTNNTERLFFLIQNKTFELPQLFIEILTSNHFALKKANFEGKEIPSIIWIIFLLSALLLISFYAFFQFLLTQNKGYFFYGLFTFFSFIAYLQNIFELYWSSYLFFNDNSHTRFNWRLAFMLSHIFQTIFFYFFFDLKRKNFKYYNALNYYFYAQIICAVAYALLILFRFPNTYFGFVRAINNPIVAFGGLSLIYLIFKERKGNSTNFVIIGSLSFLLISTYSIFFMKNPQDFKGYPLDRLVFSIGTFVEIIFFWISLAVRDRENERAMQQFKTVALSNEIKALRSQMNPHFIFNCLNSLNLYILENHIDAASDYLQRFSKLIRLVLENSRLERIPLKNELDALKLYMNLETMRFKHKLTFYIEVDENIETEMITVPPLLLQPFIENSIWHGLMHKIEGGTIHLKITQPNDNVLCAEIIDDGIGRAAASEIKSKSATKQKSFGMKVTNERIAAINEIYNVQARADIIDLVDENGKANGTKVVIKIPI